MAWVQLAAAAISALGSSSKVDASSTVTQSGLGIFEAENTVKKNQPAIDLSEPLQVALLALAGVVMIYIYKKVT